MNSIKVLTTAAECAEERKSPGAAVVVNVFRTNTCMVVALERGCAKIRPVPSVDQVVELRKLTGKEGWLTAGERDTDKIPGFDLGNSPQEFESRDFKGRSIIYTSSSGAQAVLTAAGKFGKVYLACLRNGRAVAEKAAGEATLSLVCAGRKGRLALEDLFCAGKIICAIEAIQGAPVPQLNDAAIAARLLYLGGLSPEIFLQHEHAQLLRARGLGDDVAFCLEEDKSTVVPYHANGLVLA
ncbi:MAG: 2-phosphosulfolactate phosphatase [Magnetococcales bacterium]|nr:2-phosphosulfolactate phosphatase [Magnetococcales bacterium]